MVDRIPSSASLAAIYDDRSFDRLPLLSDARLDADCDDPAIIAHCRSPDPHVRGCWVVDAALGLEWRGDEPDGG